MSFDLRRHLRRERTSGIVGAVALVLTLLALALFDLVGPAPRWLHALLMVAMLSLEVHIFLRARRLWVTRDLRISWGGILTFDGYPQWAARLLAVLYFAFAALGAAITLPLLLLLCG